MKKKVVVVTVAEAEEAATLAELPLEATVALAEVAGPIKDGLLAFASATGLVVMHQMMDAELTGRVGAKDARILAGERTGNWHGTAKGSVVLGGRQVAATRPRGRTKTDTDVELRNLEGVQLERLLTSLLAERMLAGVATRRHADVAEPVGADLEARSKGLSKSAISRRLVKATETVLAETHQRASPGGAARP